MKKKIQSLVFCVFCILCVHAQQLTSIIPQPVSYEQGIGEFEFSRKTIIGIDDEKQIQVANYLSNLFSTSAGFFMKVSPNKKGSVRLVTDSTMKKGAYQLIVTSQQILIKASGPEGLFYAVQSIRMSLPPAIECNTLIKERKWMLPAMKVYDEPRFDYRGLMLDVARFFLPKQELLQVIDCISLLKINTLHLHLTDSNGWRIEIKKYPLLTSIGANRVDRTEYPFPCRKNQKEGETTVPSGYYSQEDIKEIIHYAAERQITIIPEIDVPGHSNAALAAYPAYACPIVDKFISVIPGMGEDHSDIIFCAGNEKTFQFLEDILDEVMELFPSEYIHLGGDEVIKNYWKKCPLCQARVEKEQLPNEEALQAYFMRRLNDYVRSKGRRMMGWDELTNSEVPENAVIFGWRGNGLAALKAAEKGHPFILTPARQLYFIRYQGPQWFEPLTYFGNITLKDVYNYEPVKEEWSPSVKQLLWGIQASMWTEFCNKPEDVTYQLFPRLAAFSEVAWSSERKNDWLDFLRRIDVFTEHLTNKGITYAKSMYNIQHTSKPVGSELQISLETERSDMQIRYTLDGTTPTTASELYCHPISVNRSVLLKSALFEGHKRMGEILEIPISWNKATAQHSLQDSSRLALLFNGVRGSLRESDFEWCTWMNPSFSFDIDLGRAQTFCSVSVGTLTNSSMCVHKPKSLVLEYSIDGTNYKTLGKKQYTTDEIFREGNYVEELSFQFSEVAARYVRIKVENPGSCPTTHIRPGSMTKVCFDEVQIK